MSDKHKLTKEYFQDQGEIAQLEGAIWEVILVGIRYDCIVIALTNVLNQVVAKWMQEENSDRWHP